MSDQPFQQTTPLQDQVPSDPIPTEEQPVDLSAAADDALSELMQEDVVDDAPVVKQRNRQALFSWHQVGAVVAFSRVFDRADPSIRDSALQVLGWEAGATPDAVDVAQDLYPSGGVLGAYDLFSTIVRKMATGTLGFRDGMKMTQQLTDTDADTIKAYVRMVNVFGAEEIRYTRRMAAPQVIDAIMESLEGLGDGIKRVQEVVDWLDTALAVWPGEAA